MKYVLSLFLFFAFSLTAAEDITGFWQTMRANKEPSSVIAVYPYQGKYYGRIIATYNDQGVMDDTIYNPKNRTDGLKGNPHYSGIDIVLYAQPEGNRFIGYVMDPRNGKVYNAKLWKEDGNLILRGEVFIFGRSQAWLPFPESGFNNKFKKPDISTFVPVLYQPAD